MIPLYAPPRPEGWPGIYNMSPFCQKLECYFRITNTAYELKLADIRKAPKGRVPFVKIDGQYLGDSGLIMNLLEKNSAAPLDAHLSAPDKAILYAMSALIEDHLYFALARLRWCDGVSVKYLKEFFVKFLPPVVGGFIFERIRADFRNTLKKQGMGRHSRDEVVTIAKDSLQSLSDFLGDKPFFMGDRVTTLDTSAYGFLPNILRVPWDCEVKAFANGLSNLTVFCERMESLYWKDVS